jgi:hypothetical protein
MDTGGVEISRTTDKIPTHTSDQSLCMAFLWHVSEEEQLPTECITTCPHGVFHEYAGDFQEILTSYMKRK